MTNETALVILDDIFKREEKYKDKPLYIELAETYRSALEKCASDSDPAYRWHDLRKDPSDLPESKHQILCAWTGSDRVSWYDTMWFYRDDEDGDYFSREGVSYGIGCRYHNVFAWRYIEEVEE